MGREMEIMAKHSISDVINNDDRNESTKYTNGEILSDLIKSFTRNPSMSDSGNDSDEDLKSLIDKMTSCDMNEKKTKPILIKQNKNPAESKHGRKVTEPIKCDKTSKPIESKMTTLQVKIKVKKDKAHKSVKNYEAVDDLSGKVSRLRLSKENDVGVKDIKSKNHKKTSPIDENNKEKIKFMERGPTRSSFNSNTRLPPYEKSEIHRRSLSGGNVLMKPYIDDDNVPITVKNINNNNIKIAKNSNQNISAFTSNVNKNNETLSEFDRILKEKITKKHDQFDNWKESLGMIMEIIEKEHINQNDLNDERMIPYLNVTYYGDNNVQVSESFNSEPSTPSTNTSSPAYNHDENYASGTDFEISMVTINNQTIGYQSPTMDNLECANNYDNENFYEPRLNSSSESSYTQDEKYAVFDNTSPPMYSQAQFSFNQDLRSVSSGYGSSSQDIYDMLEKSPENTTSTQYNMATSNTLNAPKVIYPTIAPNEGFPCCRDYLKSAKEEMEELFNNLDLKVKTNLCLKVHSEDDNKLIEWLDGQLSHWSNVAPELPQLCQLELLYTTCERLLLKPETMMKFYEVYSNGHTILDRAVLTCSESPLVARYLAECMLQILPNILKSEPIADDYIWNMGKNTIVHRATRKGEQCVAALAGLFELNRLYNKNIFDINKVDSEGYTPLHLACINHLSSKCSCLLMVHVLLKHGKANPNIKDRLSGNTPLHVVVLDGSSCAPALVAMLLEYNANPLIKNYGKHTPLDLARRAKNNTQYSKRVFEMLKVYK